MTQLQAFMYLQEAEIMPVDAPDEWFLQSELSSRLIESTHILEVALRQILEDLSDDQSEEELQSVFYEAGKQHFGTGKDDLRMFFRGLYQILFQKPQGPRWGQFVSMMGVDQFRDFAIDRLSNPLMLPVG